MASPAWQSVSSGQGTGTSFTASDPSGAADGDGLVMSILIEDTISGFTGPSGWTQHGTSTGLDAGAFRVFHFSLRRSGSPSYGVSWTTSRYFEWTVTRTNGIVSSGAFVEAFAEGTPASGSTPDPPSATALTAETLVLIFGYTWSGWGTVAAPANYTLRYGPNAIDNGNATRALAAAGAEDPGTFTGTGGTDDTVGITMILASQSAAGGGGATIDHQSTLGFPALSRKPRNDNGRWTRGKGGLWVPRRAA